MRPAHDPILAGYFKWILPVRNRSRDRKRCRTFIARCVAALVMIDSTLVEGGHSSQDAAVANPLSFVSNRGALPLSSQGRIGRLKRNLETKAAVTVCTRGRQPCCAVHDAIPGAIDLAYEVPSVDVRHDGCDASAGLGQIGSTWRTGRGHPAGTKKGEAHRAEAYRVMYRSR